MDLQKIKELSIYSIVSRFIPLPEQKGSSLVIHCPFHKNENTPALALFEKTGTFMCYSCHIHGDAIEFVKRLTNVDFKSAAMMISDMFHLQISQKEEEFFQAKKEVERLGSFLASLYADALQSNQSALNYLQQREIQQESITHYHIGYGIQTYEKALQHFSKETIHSSGFYREKEGVFIDRMINRIVLPFKRHQTVVGFTGRTLDPNHKAKYINTESNPFFEKKSFVFGVEKAEHIILCEGPFDAIRLHQFGLKSGAILGSFLSPEQLKFLLGEGIQSLELAFDGDKAGISCSIKSIHGLLSYERATGKSISLSIRSLESGKDPDSYDADSFRSLPILSPLSCIQDEVLNKETTFQSKIKKSIAFMRGLSTERQMEYLSPLAIFLGVETNLLSKALLSSSDEKEIQRRGDILSSIQKQQTRNKSLIFTALKNNPELKHQWITFLDIDVEETEEETTYSTEDLSLIWLQLQKEKCTHIIKEMKAQLDICWDNPSLKEMIIRSYSSFVQQLHAINAAMNG